MPLDPRMILSGAQSALQAGQPNVLGALQAGQQIQSDVLRQQAQLEALEQLRAQAPLQQQLLQQRVRAGQQSLEQGKLTLEQTMAKMDDDTRTRSVQGMISLANQASVLPAHQQAAFVRENAAELDIPGVADLSDFAINASDEEILDAIPKLIQAGQSPSIKTGSGTANIKDYEFYTDLKKTDPQGAEMFAKDVGLIPKDRPLSAVSEKALIASQDRFFELSTNAREYSLLADDYRRFASNMPAGASASIQEFISRVSGTQGEAEELRRRFAKVRLAEALQYLPPGPATDRDVEEAFKGVPDINASVDQVESFLRGASKVSAIEAEFQEFKANYISEKDGTKGLIPAWKEHIKQGNSQAVNALTAADKTEELTDRQKRLQELRQKAGF